LLEFRARLAVEVPVPDEPEEPDEPPLHVPVPVLLEVVPVEPVLVVPVPAVVIVVGVTVPVVVVCARSCESRL